MNRAALSLLRASYRGIVLHAFLVVVLGLSIVFVQNEVRRMSAQQQEEQESALARMQLYDALVTAFSEIMHEQIHLPDLATPRDRFLSLQRISKISTGIERDITALAKGPRRADIEPALRAARRSAHRVLSASDEMKKLIEDQSVPTSAMCLDFRAACSLIQSQIALLRERDLAIANAAALDHYHTLVRHVLGALVLSLVFIVFLGANLLWRARAEAEIRRLNAGLERTVAERTAELAASNRELESFTRAVSHDLRSPLRGIDGWSFALAEDYGPALDARAHGYITSIRTQTQQMGRLIDSLLKLSRLTRCEMQRAPVDVTSLAQRIVESLRQLEPGREVTVSIQPGMTAFADPVLLHSAMDNLIGNAWKFTARTASPLVEVGSSHLQGRTVYHVRDNGAGFDMAYADKLFKPFQRLHRTNEFPGNGVGLTTVARIVARHGGTVWAEAAPDSGATFFFTIEPAAGEANDNTADTAR